MAQDNTIVTILSARDKMPLIGAAIQPVENSGITGWISDVNGKVILTITEPTNIRLSYIGYISKETIVAPGQSISIELEEDVLGLEEVVVTGAFVPTTSSQSLYKVRKLDASFIEARGSVNLGDVLQTQLNLKTIQDDVLGTRVVMQGISGSNVKMLMDGVPMINGAGGEFDISQINMNNVERVEIVEGPLSVQYGTNALAGTINVITKTYGVDETFASINAYYESVGQYNADLVLAKGWKNLSVNAGITRNRFNGYSSTDERSENWVPRTQYIADAKIKTSLKSINITGAYNQMWQSSTNRGNASSAFNSQTGKLSEIAKDDYNNTIRLNGSLIADGKISGNQYINLVNGVSIFEQSSRGYLQDVIDDVKWLSTDPEEHDTTRYTSWTFRGTYVNGNANKKVGVYFTAGYEASINYASGGRISEDADGSVNEYGLFTALEIPFGIKVKVQPALRYIYSNSYDARDINFLNAGLPILPSLNFMYTNGTKFDFRISYGKGYRTPSVRELYYEFIDANHYIVGNTDLLPEVGNNLNASASWRTNYGEVSTAITPSVFFSKIDNKIDLIQIIDRETLPDEVPKNVPVARAYENIPNFKSYGLNLTAEFAWQNGVRLSPGFGMLARSGSEADDKFYYSYEANLNAGYFLKKIDTRINLFYKYNGQITEFAREEDGSIGVLTLDDYHTLDISLSKSFLNGGLFTSIGAKNIFDVTDISLVGEGGKGLVLQTGREDFYPISWGRTFFIKINYTIQ
ncbi:MAG: TonB-dependent receptor [Cytophagales bacterium]|nr:TonB-dependent receptor [Cytophagales bacterium]